MKIIRTKYFPPKNYDAINILGLLFVHPGVRLNERTHQPRAYPHTSDDGDAYPTFYIWYVIEWLIRLSMAGRAYMNLSFEREAYQNMNNLNYLNQRRPFAWIKYLKKK